jgi:hypothetical protein
LPAIARIDHDYAETLCRRLPAYRADRVRLRIAEFASSPISAVVYWPNIEPGAA